MSEDIATYIGFRGYTINKDFIDEEELQQMHWDGLRKGPQ